MKYLTCSFLFLSIFVACGQAGGNTSAQKEGASADSTQTVTEPVKKPEKKFTADDIILEKELLYDKYTLEDTYPYKDTVRVVQFDKMKERLFVVDSMQKEPAQWGVLQNRKNANGESTLVKEWTRNDYKLVADMYGVSRYQSVSLYKSGDSIPERYGRDGSLVKILGENADSTMYRIEGFKHNAPGIWEVPKKYVKPLKDPVVFRKVIMVDRHNQNIASMEKMEGKWLIRSVNPATTGVKKPPYSHQTPTGMFVIQEKKVKMYYLHDGRSDLAGYAPWASRFSNGGYLHGVPTNNPNGAIIEFSGTLGTAPRSHMCVRNSSSHAKFMYDWAPVGESIVFVYE